MNMYIITKEDTLVLLKNVSKRDIKEKYSVTEDRVLSIMVDGRVYHDPAYVGMTKGDQLPNHVLEWYMQ